MAKSKAKKKQPTTDVWTRVLSIVIGVCVLAGLLVGIFVPTGLADTIFLHIRTAEKSEHYTINNAQFMYMTYSVYNNYYQTYYQYNGNPSQYGMDRTKPLSQQSYFGTTQSWGDVCIDEAKSNISQLLSVCEAALAANYQLTDEDKQSIEDSFNEINEIAKSNNMSFADTVASLYGSKGITKGDIKKMLEIQTLAQSYITKVRDEFTYTTEEYEKEFNDNKNDYLKVDYKSFTVNADTTGITDEDQKTAVENAAKEDAKYILELMEGGKTFEEAVLQYNIKKTKDDIEALKKEAEEQAAQPAEETTKETTEEATETKEEAEPEETIEDKIKKLEDQLAKYTAETVDEETMKAISDSITETKRHAYSDSSEIDKWLFDDDSATNGAMKLLDDGTTVYLVTKSKYRETYKSANIRELSIMLSDFSTEEEMKTYAESILKAYNESDKTPEAFDKLAETFTTDKITVTASGLAKETRKQTSSLYDDINAWLFGDEQNLNEGDTTTINYKDSGISLYRFEGYGREAWIVEADAALRNDDAQAKLDEYKEQYKVTINEDAISKLF